MPLEYSLLIDFANFMWFFRSAILILLFVLVCMYLKPDLWSTLLIVCIEHCCNPATFWSHLSVNVTSVFQSWSSYLVSVILAFPHCISFRHQLYQKEIVYSVFKHLIHCILDTFLIYFWLRLHIFYVEELCIVPISLEFSFYSSYHPR